MGREDLAGRMARISTCPTLGGSGTMSAWKRCQGAYLEPRPALAPSACPACPCHWAKRPSCSGGSGVKPPARGLFELGRDVLHQRLLPELDRLLAAALGLDHVLHEDALEGLR